MPGSDLISQFFGYASIVSWLGAQFPQIFQNIRLGSCEGLSLPFLLNWYLGDCSNLIGCILTNQLPFQTWLATYFVCVDTTLLLQYFYYNTRPTKPTDVRQIGHERAISGSQSTIRPERTPSRYRTISAVAANVAAAAALAARQDEQGYSRRHPRPRRHTDCVQDVTYGVEEGEDVPSKMTDSFYSEGGHTTGQKRVSWSIERHRPRGTSLGSRSLFVLPGASSVLLSHNTSGPPSGEHSDGTERARPSQPAIEVPPSPTISLRRNSRASRKRASLIFLGVWALFGLGGFTSGGKHTAEVSDSQAIGRVLGTSTVNVPSLLHLENRNYGGSIRTTFDQTQDGLDADLSHSDAANDRFLGRIFAWLCTTLYLASRLPQIWKNYVRKSVEGLSISLFICAFLGNVFYVASILISPRFYQPPPLSTQYIRESVPYLLGSGGTLMFDITIVTQFFIYRTRPRRYSLVQESLTSEETALLSGSQIHNYIDEHPPRGRTSHVKTTEGP